MASFGLPLVVEYRTRKEDYVVHYKLLNPRAFEGWRSAYYNHVLFWIPFFGLAIFAALKANLDFVAVIFLVALVGYIRQIIAGDRSNKAAIEETMSAGLEKHIRLELHERGFTEDDSGVESFAPWFVMKNCCIYQGVLFIELANSLWALIPAATLKPETVSIQEIHRLLIENGVPERRPAKRNPNLA